MSRAIPLYLSSLLGVLAAFSPAHALTFSEWQSVYFNAGQLANSALIAPAADPDDDGLSNLAEYVFTGDPLFTDPGLAPQSGQSGNQLTLTYRERTDLSGTEVWLQGGDDLSHWATFNTLEEIARVNGTGYSDITLRDPFPISPKRFLRLRLLLTPLPPLQAPANFGLSIENSNQIHLRWSDLNVTETGYAVEKLDPLTQTWARKITFGPDTTEWIDHRLDGYDGVAYRVVTLSQDAELASDSLLLADATQNTIPDWWENLYFGYAGVDPWGDANGNGISNRDEYLEGTNPVFDFYQGIAPQLVIVQGNQQTRSPGMFLALPWTVRLTHPDGTPWTGAPVRFTCTAEEGLLAEEPTETAPLRPALTVNTDDYGYAQVWLKCP